jgi:hypothetical protein
MKLKKSNIILICLAIVYFANIAANYVITQNMTGTSTIKGSGNLKTSEITFSAFEKINFNIKAEVFFHAGEEYRAVVTIDENLLEYLEIITDDNVLIIMIKGGYGVIPTKFTVDVYCPVLTGVTMSGSGNFSSVDKIIAPAFESNVTGSGRVEATIECDSYTAKITGSGRITVFGNSNDANISIAGSGNFNGNELNTKNANVAITGSGNVNVSVTDVLNASISGSGNITYSGTPKINSNISGSGRIRER